MTYRETYPNDIFISYAHVDNLPVFHQEQGWIEQFCEDLQILLVQRMGRVDDVKIWWDRTRLDGSMVFDNSIESAINRSATFICLLSPGYLKSDYCQKELDSFYSKAQKESIGLMVNERFRIINVRLYDIPFKQWPPELGGKTGFPFYHKNKEDAEDDWGSPMDMEDQQFRDQLQELRDTLANLIDDIKNPPAPPLPPAVPCIYFGDVADSLRTLRKRTIGELEKQGYTVICDVPPPYEREEHEIAVKQKTADSILSVHLLDQLPGREIEGEEALWYPQTQVEIGLTTDKRQLIWLPAETNIEVIEESQYKTFLQSLESGQQAAKKIDFIKGAKSELTKQITDLVEELKREQEQLKAGTMAGGNAVLLDTHLSDQSYALKVSKCLQEAGISAYFNSVEDDPRQNANILEDRISKVNKLIFFYGKVTWNWVKGRMTMALQSIVSNLYPVEEFIVFLAPPHKDPKNISLRQWVLKVNVVNNSDALQLDNNSLQQFIESIKKHDA